MRVLLISARIVGGVLAVAVVAAFMIVESVSLSDLRLDKRLPPIRKEIR